MHVCMTLIYVSLTHTEMSASEKKVRTTDCRSGSKFVEGSDYTTIRCMARCLLLFSMKLIMHVHAHTKAYMQ